MAEAKIQQFETLLHTFRKRSHHICQSVTQLQIEMHMIYDTLDELRINILSENFADELMD